MKDQDGIADLTIATIQEYLNDYHPGIWARLHSDGSIVISSSDYVILSRASNSICFFSKQYVRNYYYHYEDRLLLESISYVLTLQKLHTARAGNCSIEAGRLYEKLYELEKVVKGDQSVVKGE